MKKFLALLLALILTLSCFAGCAPTGENNSSEPSQPEEPQIEVISIEKALELCGEPGNLTTEKYYIRGTVETVTKPAYGTMTITDGTKSISVYGIIGYADMADKPYKGDEVLLCGYLQNFEGTKEIKDAELIEFKKNETPVDETGYTDMSIADARDAEAGTKIKVDGVVAQITYANGMIPSGVILVDDSGSIYVYDRDIAGRAKIGNTVTVLASKAWWILNDEKVNAQKYDYKGSCQLENATLVSISDDVKEFDKSWITKTTVKALLEAPASRNNTTKIFKVQALVSREKGSGFTNYYFYDLDGTTGSYTYTQCNGEDFAWLDDFDGQICDVYLMVMNAKATDSGIVYRFLPVAVSFEGYVFNTDETAEFIVKYYGLDQFESEYTGNPELELISSVSSKLLGFENALLRYSSSDTKVIDFKMVNGKPVMHCLANGTATVSVKGSYGGKTYTKKIEITVRKASAQGSTISWAIGQPVGKNVLIKGVVGPSLVNKTGFYLIDGTGVIAVETDAATMKQLKIGYMISISGVRGFNTKSGGSMVGQVCIKDAQLVANTYGKNEYSTKTFITDKTLADFAALNVADDYTTKVFVLKATVQVVQEQYYSNIKLVDGDTSVNLYCSSAAQYEWLQAYAGKEITVEIAPCNWNSKDYYTGCVLAVRNADGTKTYNELNFGK